MKDQLMIRHKEASVKLGYMLINPTKKDLSVIDLGESLVLLGFDVIHDGFWILDIKRNIEYYSPQFRNSLGFSNEKEFPNVPESWQKQIFPKDAEDALEAFHLHMENEDSPYYLHVRYRKKDSSTVKLICAGTIVNRNSDFPIMLGTHEIIP